MRHTLKKGLMALCLIASTSGYGLSHAHAEDRKGPAQEPGPDVELLVLTKPDVPSSCTLTNGNGGWLTYRTPEHIDINRSTDALIVSCRSVDGAYKGKIRIEPKFQGSSLFGLPFDITDNLVRLISMDLDRNHLGQYYDSYSTYIVVPLHPTHRAATQAQVLNDDDAFALMKPPAAVQVDDSKVPQYRTTHPHHHHHKKKATKTECKTAPLDNSAASGQGGANADNTGADTATGTLPGGSVKAPSTAMTLPPILPASSDTSVATTPTQPGASQDNLPS